MKKNLPELSPVHMRRLWLERQGLLEEAPFGLGRDGAYAAIRRLGYVQIDTIFVVERAHHHILWTRVPDYRPEVLRALQTEEKRVFEYWTHALSFIPTEDFRYFVRSMREHEREPSAWFRNVTPKQRRDLLRRIRRDGAISIRQIEEERQEKDHEWASRKPSKRALEHLFYSGRLAVSAREGMVKHYDALERHFGWDRRPAAVSRREEASYRIDRTLAAQGAITFDSATYLERDLRDPIRAELDRRARAGSLVRAHVPGAFAEVFVSPDDLAKKEDAFAIDPERIHVLSPFDPLLIQRRRTRALFDFDYVLECYIPEAKRKFGYFVLPVLAGERLVARIDLKADRESGRLVRKAWHWERGDFDKKRMRAAIETKLAEFARFQFER
ncbi:MAG: YcaQ family DNA glycosylase [Bdellovibrionales bacterium]|nr:YcaQ family DNA glycosylase [Bdellovibrionales bacterium]